MLYGLVFLLLAVQLSVLATVIGGWGMLLLWPATSFFLVSLAYFGAGPRVFAKRPDGTRNPVVTALLLPYLVFTYAVWWIACRLSREPIRHEIMPNLFLGRRASLRELPTNVELVIDLTSEFVSGTAIRCLPGYACLPTLDTGVPDLVRFRESVGRVATFQGVAFIHCAQGHGRSGLFVAAVLIVRGLATDAKDAVRMVRTVRPGVRLKPKQMRFLEAFARNYSPSGGSNP